VHARDVSADDDVVLVERVDVENVLEAGAVEPRGLGLGCRQWPGVVVVPFTSASGSRMTLVRPAFLVFRLRESLGAIY
jgi:hypothetical protein